MLVAVYRSSLCWSTVGSGSHGGWPLTYHKAGLPVFVTYRNRPTALVEAVTGEMRLITRRPTSQTMSRQHFLLVLKQNAATSLSTLSASSYCRTAQFHRSYGLERQQFELLILLLWVVYTDHHLSIQGNDIKKRSAIIPDQAFPIPRCPS